MSSNPHDADEQSGRLSIAFLLCLTAGIGIAITALRAIEYIRFPADNFYYDIDSVHGLDSFKLLVALLYGLCLTTFLFARRCGPIWQSPGKVLAMLFAAMCVLDWGLDGFAGALVSYRINLGHAELMNVSVGFADPRAYVFGIWYRDFAPAVGYIVALPLLAWILFKTKSQSRIWRAVWVGFFVTSLLLIAHIHFRAAVRDSAPMFVLQWYFELAFGLPSTLILLALTSSLVRRERIDWWTVVVPGTVLLVWCGGIALKVFAT